MTLKPAQLRRGAKRPTSEQVQAAMELFMPPEPRPEHEPPHRIAPNDNLDTDCADANQTTH